MLYIAPGTLMLVSADTDIREQHALANVMDKPVAYGANACTCEDCGPELQTDVDQADTDADEPQALDVDIKPVACSTHTQGDCAPELWMDIDQMHVGTTGQHHAANHHHEPPAICTDAVHPHAEMLPTRRDRDGQGSKILGQCTDSDSPPHHFAVEQQDGANAADPWAQCHTTAKQGDTAGGSIEYHAAGMCNEHVSDI